MDRTSLTDFGEEGPALEVFLAFLRLGLTSFGGPAAHIGYFRAELVERRGWLSPATFAELTALCQFLPGPASSQLGFAIGLTRAKLAGGLAAWLGFTLPSAVLMLLLAQGVDILTAPGFAGVVHGLKLAAVAIVAQAVWGMAQSLAATRSRAAIAALGFALAAMAGGIGQLLALAVGAGIGLAFEAREPSVEHIATPVKLSPKLGLGALVLFVGLMVALPVLSASRTAGAATAWAYFRSGALVFGGGHVVLPLLQDAVVKPGWVGQGVFLSGYAAAQALPGPLFTFAAYLGAVERTTPSGLLGGLVALLMIFLPGLLITTATLPFLARLGRMARVRRAMTGASAAVVGVLGAALYSPVFTSAIHGPADMSIAVAAFVALTALRVPPIAVVSACAVAGAILAR